MDEEQKREALPSGKAQDTPGGLRRRLRAARAALDEAASREGSAAIMAHLRAGLKAQAERLGAPALASSAPGPAWPRIAAFWPMPGEPDLSPLLAEWARAGVPLALPRVERREQPLAFLAWHPGAAMRPGAYGILEPDGTDFVTPDLVLVPTLGYTRQGGRVGYGGGYYDRTLGRWRAEGRPRATVGIAWRHARLADEEYAFQPHDIPLDAVVDEEGWVIPGAAA